MLVMSKAQPQPLWRGGRAVQVLLCTGEASDGPLAQRIADLGGVVEEVDELYTALSHVLEDPAGYHLLVIDCDSATAADYRAAQEAVRKLGEVISRVPVILISRDCREHQFPQDRLAATRLSAPVSPLSLRMGFEHALRDRLAYLAA